MDKTDIMSLTKEELTSLLTDKMGEKRFRAAQIYEWLHIRHVQDFNDMTNLSKDLRKRLDETCFIAKLKIVDKLVSGIDGTAKYIFELYDGNIIESVLMHYKHGHSVCISSQAGCRMGCRFCASTLGGLSRDLLPSEMLGQIYRIQEDYGERISNVVVMGSGEPLDNYDNLIRFIDLITGEDGLNISGRSITVSTCGLVPKIYELAEKRYQITLAISLHAATDEKRKKLMPVANMYSIKELLDACRYYYDKNGRRITFEYSLVKDENDSHQDASELSGLLGNFPCHVNLIPVNPIEERTYRQSESAAVSNFKNSLEKCGINVTIRREMGRDIQAACGQLRRRYMKKLKED